jgi:pterin-4a-carbinolamine dehydratase
MPSFDFQDDRSQQGGPITGRVAVEGLARQVRSTKNFPDHRNARLLTEAELLDALTPGTQLAAWSLTDFVTTSGAHATAMARSFVFADFPTALAFMQTMADPIEAMQHHPLWENSWRTVRVKLFTWSVGHKVSNLDLYLARLMESVAKEFGVEKGENVVGTLNEQSQSNGEKA